MSGFLFKIPTVIGSLGKEPDAAAVSLLVEAEAACTPSAPGKTGCGARLSVAGVASNLGTCMYTFSKKLCEI